MRKIALLCYLLASILALSSCGFHLRGPAQLPERLNPLYVEPAQLQADELSAITVALNRANARVSDSSSGANRLIVRFGPQQTRKLAQSSPTGVQLLQLSMQLDYRIQAASGEWLMQDRKITQTVELELDNSNVLSHEKLLLSGWKSLQQNLIRSMIFQLQH